MEAPMVVAEPVDCLRLAPLRYLSDRIRADLVFKQDEESEVWLNCLRCLPQSAIHFFYTEPGQLRHEIEVVQLVARLPERIVERHVLKTVPPRGIPIVVTHGDVQYSKLCIRPCDNWSRRRHNPPHH